MPGKHLSANIITDRFHFLALANVFSTLDLLCPILTAFPQLEFVSLTAWFIEQVVQVIIRH